MPPVAAMKWLWLAWVFSWLIASLWSSRAEARPKGSAEMLYRVVTLAGVALLFDLGRPILPSPEIWRTPAIAGWILVGVTAAGLLFCWWARIHLGRMWSSSVTRKADHRIVDTGPYALVRHPIYTGVITASAAMALQKASLAALAGFALVVLGFWIKARLEERFLRAELGAEAYDAYSQRTAMLFPGLR
jgi:protein-S-isoprenylcysteine O-methyltransferase Ste14